MPFATAIDAYAKRCVATHDAKYWHGRSKIRVTLAHGGHFGDIISVIRRRLPLHDDKRYAAMAATMRACAPPIGVAYQFWSTEADATQYIDNDRRLRTHHCRNAVASHIGCLTAKCRC